ncbi:selenocysteine-specific translation elongation factor [soil metagenome]
MDVIVGTAGHIDHGKTALIKALTGIDADRLPEEKRRGITVDLGFAEMSVGDVHFGFVDVPGHERFVKNMLAGASGIDLVLLVIAADEGVMPQTREHFDICRLLGINAGIVVLTKTDLADAETLELAKLDAAELVAGSFLAGAPVVCISSRTGDGIEALKNTIAEISTGLSARNDQLITRLPLDRSFSMKGFGAVVTGTLASGKIAEGDELEMLPMRKTLRVRGMQTHGKTVTTAFAGQRVAVNLAGIDHSKIERGMALAEPGVLRPTQIIDTVVEVLSDAPKPLKSRQRVRVHIGTAEVLARLHVLNEAGETPPGSTDLLQIRLETPVAAVPGERFIIRSYSPQITIAGGEVIDLLASKHHKRELAEVRSFLSAMKEAAADNAARVVLFVRCGGAAGQSFADIQARTALKKEHVTAAVGANATSGQMVEAAGRYVSVEAFQNLSELAEKAVAAFHKREPLARGISRESLREAVFAHLPDEIFLTVTASLESAGTIVADRETIRLGSHQTELSPDEAAVSKRLRSRYLDAGLEPPKLDEALADAVNSTRFTPQQARKYFQLFLDAGEIVKISEDFYFERSAIDGLITKLKHFADGTGDRLIDVAKFKELAGVSRKYAIPLLEYFDQTRVTARAGEKRRIF